MLSHFDPLDLACGDHHGNTAPFSAGTGTSFIASGKEQVARQPIDAVPDHLRRLHDPLAVAEHESDAIGLLLRTQT